MGAFNRRLEPKEINGMPLEGVVSLVLSLIFGALAMIIPGVARIVPLLLLAGSLFAAVVSFAFRAELPFLSVIIQGRLFEPGRVTSETRSRL
jgi:hypothetical protein